MSVESSRADRYEPGLSWRRDTAPRRLAIRCRARRAGLRVAQPLEEAEAGDERGHPRRRDLPRVRVEHYRGEGQGRDGDDGARSTAPDRSTARARPRNVRGQAGRSEHRGNADESHPDQRCVRESASGRRQAEPREGRENHANEHSTRPRRRHDSGSDGLGLRGTADLGHDPTLYPHGYV